MPDDGVKARINNLGGSIPAKAERTPAAFDGYVKAEIAKWAPILKAALEELPSRQRTVVVLRDIDGLSSEEVCGVLDISAGNQRILLHRARSSLREILDVALRKAE